MLLACKSSHLSVDVFTGFRKILYFTSEMLHRTALTFTWWTREKVGVFNFHVFLTCGNCFSYVIMCKSSHDIFTVSQHDACEILTIFCENVQNIKKPLFFTRVTQ